MLASQYFSPHLESDENQSLTSSPTSFEQITESFNPYHHFPQIPHFTMVDNQSQSPNLLYTNFDWNACNKPQIYARNELFSFPDLQQQSPEDMYWPKYEGHGSEYLRTKSYSPPSYISPSITHKQHVRLKSANACLTYSDQQFFSPPSVSNALVPIKDKTINLGSIDKPFPNDTGFLFNIVLNAPTAVAKKNDDEPITYLNRGQPYLLNFEPTIDTPSTVTSVISIAFHEQNHRSSAANYWKYWISQQDSPADARVLDIDANQTTGVFNVQTLSFDRISFDWHSRFGAKLYVRFNCLSTDFSRIKGVKGIPMRIVVETTQTSLDPPSNSFKGILRKTMTDEYEYKETCFCKIKLFRDKGAERKNKDNKRQIQKQLAKLISSTDGAPEDHPLWSKFVEEHKPTSPLDQTPTSPDLTIEKLDEFDDILPDHTLPPISTKRKHPFSEDIPPKKRKVPMLTVYVWTRHFNTSPKQVLLYKLTMHHLKIKLASFLSVAISRITEVVWHRKKSEEEIFVLVDDSFISEHIANGDVITVNWELKSDGNLRVILEF